MYRVRLTKIQSNHNNLRTNSIEGLCHLLPSKNESFVMFGEGLEFGIRCIRTTSVEDIHEKNTSIEFKTTNSLYKLEILNVFEEEKNC